MKYTWTIKQLNVIPSKGQYTDVVYSIVWEVTGVDGQDSATTSGALAINTDNIENFIAYQNLTQDEVLSWMFNALGQDAKQKAELQTQTVIEAKKSAINVVCKETLPWSS
jgi:hypothetical protein